MGWVGVTEKREGRWKGRVKEIGMYVGKVFAWVGMRIKR